ncbi:MAG: hypothetical protein ABR592_08130 [Nitriliruptorales bacterium]
MSLAEGAGLLAELSDALRVMQRATAEAVDLAGKVQRAGVVEVIEGLPLELLLALEHRMVSSDARMLLEAGRVLERVPSRRCCSPRARQRAQGLVRICTDWMGGGGADAVEPAPCSSPTSTWRTSPRPRLGWWSWPLPVSCPP